MFLGEQTKLVKGTGYDIFYWRTISLGELEMDEREMAQDRQCPAPAPRSPHRIMPEAEWGNSGDINATDFLNPYGCSLSWTYRQCHHVPLCTDHGSVQTFTC